MLHDDYKTFFSCILTALKIDNLCEGYFSSSEVCRIQTDATPGKRDMLLAIGKAASSMLHAFLKRGSEFNKIILVCSKRYLNPLPAIYSNRISFMNAGHPLPDASSFRAAQVITEEMQNLKCAEVRVLLSGGTSAMLAMACPDLTDADKRQVHEVLIRAGLAINEINLIRRHLSGVKGGKLLRIAQANGCRIHVTALSDVAGNKPEDIGSGPFSPDPTTFSDALEQASKIDNFPSNALKILESGSMGMIPENITIGEITGNPYTYDLLETPEGYAGKVVETLNSQGMAAATASFQEIVKSGSAEFRSMPQNLWFVACGENEVKLPDRAVTGQGGRASTLVLCLAEKLGNLGCKFVIAVIATDGADGNSETAGGYILSEDLTPGFMKEMKQALSAYDSASFLMRMNRTIPSAATGVNFGDLLLMKLYG